MLTIKERVAATPGSDRLTPEEIRNCGWVIEDAIALHESTDMTRREACAFVMRKSKLVAPIVRSAFSTIEKCLDFLTNAMWACERLGVR